MTCKRLGTQPNGEGGGSMVRAVKEFVMQEIQENVRMFPAHRTNGGCSTKRTRAHNLYFTDAQVTSLLSNLRTPKWKFTLGVK